MWGLRMPLPQCVGPSVLGGLRGAPSVRGEERLPAVCFVIIISTINLAKLAVSNKTIYFILGKANVKFTQFYFSNASTY